MPAWLAPALMAGGSVLSGMLSGGGDQEQEMKPDQFTRNFRASMFDPPQPWEIASGRYPDALNNVWRLPEQTYGPSPGFRVQQGPTPEVSGFYGGLMNRAGGAPYEASAGQYANQAVQGGFLGSNPAMGFLGGYAYGGPQNPWLDQMVTQAQRRTGRNVASMFGGSGMGGSSLERGVATRELGNVAENMYGRAYETDMNRRLQAATTLGSIYGQERGLQQEAAFNTPQLTMADLGRLQAGLGAAQGAEGYGTRQRQEDIAAHQFGQRAPYTRLGAISNMFAGVPSGQTTSVSGPSVNPMTAALGGAMAGYGMYNSGMFGGQAPGGSVQSPTGYQTGVSWSPTPGAVMPSWGTGFGSYT